jgi:hypothetical protein
MSEPALPGVQVLLQALKRFYRQAPREPGNTYDWARLHVHTVCCLRQTRSATPRTHTENLRPNSYTNGADAFDATKLP